MLLPLCERWEEVKVESVSLIPTQVRLVLMVLLIQLNLIQHIQALSMPLMDATSDRIHASKRLQVPSENQRFCEEKFANLELQNCFFFKF